MTTYSLTTPGAQGLDSCGQKHWIKLTLLKNGDPILVNLDNIVCAVPEERGTEVRFTDGRYFYVRETIEEIEKLQERGESCG